LLIGTGGFLAWQWRHNGFPFNRLTAGNSSGQQTSPPSGAAPDASQSQETQAEKPTTGAGDVLPTESVKKTQADSSSHSSDASGQEKSNSASPDKGTTHSAEKAEKAEAAPPPVSQGKAHTKLEPAHTRAKSATVETAALATPPDADLELAGERYLYGTGLPQNCARAESSLRTAAMHGNSKAETVLGTMYATGHCVGRDLTTAYRWFARALHQEPQNSRISADLQVLWRQMTPEEKQLATTSKQ
jgi:hypothetical protein